MILLRVLRADLRRYNAQRDDENNDVLEVLCCNQVYHFQLHMIAHALVGDWLEAGSRRRLPRSRLAYAPGCFRGLWRADAGHDRHHHGYVLRAPNHSYTARTST